eukprot:CAMPEP_0202339224 /NCGR_PEP_ID=MMETSP1126-20121109/1180_1 /ASSEMBLY_ACC=CAM_ASM_000457 /TAXON_ID=3047 /ORGANISM="Dunaliella tertiolecta, Strain CCMP1320" /LENGTH=800 /DNA_ID=CAMNT_0048929749 /DNA_START=75 /DNA_END=2477 /DNA_ORIENTATION=+
MGAGVWLGLRNRVVAIPPLFKRKARPMITRPAALGAPQTGLVLSPKEYPIVRRDESVVDNLHGVKVADPYRFLEDPDSPETRAFVDAQNELTAKVLPQCETRENFKELFTSLYDYAKQGTPFKCGDRYYYFYNSGLQQQYVLYSQQNLDSPAKVLLDPNTLSKDGTIALKDTEFSEDGRLMAYQLSSGGSDWAWIQVMSISPDGEPNVLPDKLELVKFSSLAWTHDHKGFFYNRFPKGGKEGQELGTETNINTNQLLCYHKVGTPQSEDPIVWHTPAQPEWMTGASLSDDGRYVLLYVSEGCQPANRLFIVDTHELTERTPDGLIDWKAYDVNTGRKKLPVKKLVDNFDASYSYVANEGTTFYFKTNLKAPRYKIVKTDVARPTPPSSWQDLVPEHEKDVLKGALALKGDALVTRYLRDVRGELQLRSLSTGALQQEFELESVGSVTGVSGQRKESEFFFSFTSFVEPGATYRVDLSAPTGTKHVPTLFKRTELKVPHNPADYETKQVFVPSKDGTRIPMFITHKKGLKLDGSLPTLLYGYGGFNISLEPGFSATRLTFMRGYNGVYAQASIRGGGEYGVGWRDAGSLQHKQNCFDDFQACAEHLIAAGYASPATLTIQGGSNGGLLVAACANQRPDLYACVLGQVGVMDMLRFHKFTIGHAWQSDFGSPDKAKEFEYILPYSPLHNVRVPEGGSRQYPAVLLTTGDHDDRVVPLHSYKLIAELQHTLGGPESAQRNPLIIRIDVRSGHGAGKPTKKIIEEAADSFGFAAKCMRAKWVDAPLPKPDQPEAATPTPASANA